MKSNLEEFYDLKDEFDLLNNKSYFMTSNPFYMVNKFIKDIDSSLNKNFVNNIKRLKFINSLNNYASSYDVKSNLIYSKNNKSDIFVLFHVASNDITKKYSGIISEDGIGYGLNNGITDLFTNMVNNKKIVYPIEAVMAHGLFMLDKNTLASSYFNNDYKKLEGISDNIDNLKVLIDNYHKNYLELNSLYKESFTRGRFYHNSIYGRDLRKKDTDLLDIDKNIFNLENDNYTTIYDSLSLLKDIINNSDINEDRKIEIINILNNEFNNITRKENFEYLNGLNDLLIRDMPSKRLVRWKK